MNISAEDYLGALYHLYEKQDDKSIGIKAIYITRLLKVSKASVSEMVKKLAKKSFVKSKPYSNIFLTKKGLEEGKRIKRNHRVIEVFLKNVLKYNVNEACNEAHKLEHAFSQESIKRLERFLNKPKKCPHGRKIID